MATGTGRELALNRRYSNSSGGEALMVKKYTQTGAPPHSS